MSRGRVKIQHGLLPFTNIKALSLIAQQTKRRVCTTELDFSYSVFSFLFTKLAKPWQHEILYIGRNLQLSTQHVCDVESQHVSCDAIAAAMNELNLSVCAIVAWLNSSDLREHELHQGQEGTKGKMK